MRDQFIYRHWTGNPETDETASALYEGISVNPGSRSADHQIGKGYWRLVKWIEVEAFPPGTSRADALDKEAELIGKNRLPFNKVHNPNWKLQAKVRQEWLRQAGAVSRRSPKRAVGDWLAYWRWQAKLKAISAAKHLVFAVAVVAVWEQFN